MQTLYTIEDHETGGVKTLLHVSTYTTIGLVVIIYTSDEFGTHKGTVKQVFADKIERVYHKLLREKVKKEGGIVHKRVSDTPLTKTVQHSNVDLIRDNKGRFVSPKNKK
jgi:hypothetical protein